MLHINKITIKNFRPYFGLQTFDFGEKDGLSIVFGDNGVGKTSLIKAIKFVLYGEFDSSENFKIKKEMNIIAWEQQNFDLYVSLEFLYNSDNYILKRSKTIKANIYGVPNNDADFIDTVTLIKNGNHLSFSDTNNVLKNIIPKEISEYILFEGETITKYKDLLDNKKNLEIYNSIRKILGITNLENSKHDLENQLGRYEDLKSKQTKEQIKNQKIRAELNKIKEELNRYKMNKETAKKNLEIVIQQKEKYEDILKNNQRMNELINKKNDYNNKLEIINQDIKVRKNDIKEILKQYKTYCYDFIDFEINNVPDDIQKIKELNEKNKNLDLEIEEFRKIVNSPKCKYCGRAIYNEEINTIENEINLRKAQKITISSDKMLTLKAYNLKISVLKNIIESTENKNLKKDIQKLESEVQSKLIKKDNYSQEISRIKTQINDLGGVNNLEQIVKDYATCLKNEGLYNATITKCEQEIQKSSSIAKNIENKEINSINLVNINNKIEKTKKIINIFTKAIDEYSKTMRKKVQKDASKMFKEISENQEYDRLEFDEFYGLKLLDVENREVPNVSSGYMTLITISLIYGLHKNSSLTGTIILDAPFSMLTNFHRDKIIRAFQTLSPQVLLFVYRDQVNFENIRNTMQGRLVIEYEIYQDRNEMNSSYKTSIREV